MHDLKDQIFWGLIIIWAFCFLFFPVRPIIFWGLLFGAILCKLPVFSSGNECDKVDEKSTDIKKE